MADSSNNSPAKKASKKASKKATAKKAASKKTTAKKAPARKQASPARSEMEELLAALNASETKTAGAKRPASVSSLKAKMFPEDADVMTYVIAAVAAVISIAALFLVVSRSGSSRADVCKDSLAAIQQMSSAAPSDQAAFGQNVAKAEANCTYREYNSFTSSLMSASTIPVTTTPTTAPSSMPTGSSNP